MPGCCQGHRLTCSAALASEAAAVGGGHGRPGPPARHSCLEVKDGFAGRVAEPREEGVPAKCSAVQWCSKCGQPSQDPASPLPTGPAHIAHCTHVPRASQAAMPHLKCPTSGSMNAEYSCPVHSSLQHLHKQVEDEQGRRRELQARLLLRRDHSGAAAAALPTPALSAGASRRAAAQLPPSPTQQQPPHLYLNAEKTPAFSWPPENPGLAVTASHALVRLSSEMSVLHTSSGCSWNCWARAAHSASHAEGR